MIYFSVNFTSSLASRDNRVLFRSSINLESGGHVYRQIKIKYFTVNGIITLSASDIPFI
jgi:hypothetical protein